MIFKQKPVFFLALFTVLSFSISQSLSYASPPSAGTKPKNPSVRERINKIEELQDEGMDIAEGKAPGGEKAKKPSLMESVKKLKEMDKSREKKTAAKRSSSSGSKAKTSSKRSLTPQDKVKQAARKERAKKQEAEKLKDHLDLKNLGKDSHSRMVEARDKAMKEHYAKERERAKQEESRRMKTASSFKMENSFNSKKAQKEQNKINQAYNPKAIQQDKQNRRMLGLGDGSYEHDKQKAAQKKMGGFGFKQEFAKKDKKSKKGGFSLGSNSGDENKAKLFKVEKTKTAGQTFSFSGASSKKGKSGGFSFATSMDKEKQTSGPKKSAFEESSFKSFSY